MICMFLKVARAEAGKISYQQASGFFQLLETTPLTAYIRQDNLNNFFNCRVHAKKWKDRHGQHCSNKQDRSEKQQET